MITTYSNGWGHLIVTLAVLTFAGVMLIMKAVDSTTVIGLVSTVVAFWFLSGSSKFQQPTQPTPAPLQPQNQASTVGTLP